MNDLKLILHDVHFHDLLSRRPPHRAIGLFRMATAGKMRMWTLTVLCTRIGTRHSNQPVLSTSAETKQSGGHCDQCQKRGGFICSGTEGAGIGTCPPLAGIGAYWIACVVLYAKTILAAGKAEVAVLTPRCACVEIHNGRLLR